MEDPLADSRNCFLAIESTYELVMHFFFENLLFVNSSEFCAVLRSQIHLENQEICMEKNKKEIG